MSPAWLASSDYLCYQKSSPPPPHLYAQPPNKREIYIVWSLIPFLNIQPPTLAYSSATPCAVENNNSSFFHYYYRY